MLGSSLDLKLGTEFDGLLHFHQKALFWWYIYIRQTFSRFFSSFPRCQLKHIVIDMSAAFVQVVWQSGGGLLH